MKQAQAQQDAAGLGEQVIEDAGKLESAYEMEVRSSACD